MSSIPNRKVPASRTGSTSGGPVRASRGIVRASRGIGCLVVACLATSCLSPLASRRAQVLEPGEVELSVTPGIGLSSEIIEGGLTVPALVGGLSGRFGVFERTDLQLKIDAALMPELSVGYQLVGDPSLDEVAVTLTLGVSGYVEPSLGIVERPTVEHAGWGVRVPVQLLVDVPLGEGLTAIGGLGLAGGVFRDRVGVLAEPWTEPRLWLTPRLSFALDWRLGDLLSIRPEIASGLSFQVAGPPTVKVLIPEAVRSSRVAVPNVTPTVELSAGVGIVLLLDFVPNDDEAH